MHHNKTKFFVGVKYILESIKDLSICVNVISKKNMVFIFMMIKQIF